MIQHASLWPIGVDQPMEPGPVMLPTGRQVFWTGRVAIGLRHAPEPDYRTPVPQSQLWVQDLLLHNPHRYPFNRSLKT